MDAEGFETIAQALNAGWDRQPMSGETAKFYFAGLSDLPVALAQTAIASLATTAKWRPSVAEIREVAFSFTTGDIPTPAEAWANVVDVVENQVERSRPEFHSSILARSVIAHPTTAQAVAGMGGIGSLADMVRNSGVPLGAMRAQFLRMFEGCVIRYQRDVTELPSVREARRLRGAPLLALKTVEEAQ